MAAEAEIIQTHQPEQLIQQPMHEGIHAVAEFIDRQQIEGKAQELIRQREQLPLVEVKRQEYQDNARTALMEAMTASGHLSRVEISGTLEEINAQVLSRLLNGWNEFLPSHEKDRRFAELCNELIIQKVHVAIVEGLLPPDTEVGEISDYPEVLRYDATLGYRHKNKKGFARSTHLTKQDDITYTRVIETVSRSNGTWPSTFEFFRACGITTQQKSPDIAALEAPFIYTKQDYVDRVVDIMRLLDRYSGPHVRYGDSGERLQQHVPYEELRQESERREQEIEHYIDSLASLEHQLDQLTKRNQISYRERTQIFKGEVDRILSAICTLEPSYAEDTFGKQAAVYFYQAARLEAQGHTAQAQQVLEQAQYVKQTITFCGMSISVEKAKEMGLEVNSYGDLVQKGKESWKWKQGVCVVQSCPTRPGKTEVGPCSVCKKCQLKFDKGKDPTKDKVIPFKLKQPKKLMQKKVA